MRTSHPTFWRYTAFQIPGWLVAALGGWWIHQSFDVPLWFAAGLLLIWVIKDYALYPMLRFAYEADHRPRIEHLIGAQGKAVEPLAPIGYVRVRGELWQATHRGSERVISRGDEIEVTDIQERLLIVRRLSAEIPVRPR